MAYTPLSWHPARTIVLGSPILQKHRRRPALGIARVCCEDHRILFTLKIALFKLEDAFGTHYFAIARRSTVDSQTAQQLASHRTLLSHKESRSSIFRLYRVCQVLHPE